MAIYSIFCSFSQNLFLFLTKTGQVTAPTLSSSKKPIIFFKESFFGKESASTIAIISLVAIFRPLFNAPAFLRFFSLLINRSL